MTFLSQWLQRHCRAAGVCKFICGAQNASRLKCHTLIGLSFLLVSDTASHAVYRYTRDTLYRQSCAAPVTVSSINHCTFQGYLQCSCICRCMHVRDFMHVCVCVCVQYLTCGGGPLSGTSPGVLGANAPSLQQSLEGAVLPWRGNTAEPLGTAQRVHATGLSLGQHWRAASSVMVPGGPTCPQWIPAGGTDLEGPQAVRPGPWSAVGNQQQNNGC